MSIVLEFTTHTWAVMAELAPWLFLGAAVSGLLHIMLPDGFIHRQLSGRLGVLKAVALGIPMPLCSCGVIPTGIGLKQDGASNGASVGFITATPQTGVDSILVSASFLGWPFALTKVVAALVTGVASGLATDLVSPTPAEATSADGGGSCSTPKARTVRAGVDHGLDVIQSIWGWLVSGVLLSAALSTWLPADFFSGLVAVGTLTTFLIVLVGSVPLYICATASVPVAASLVHAGMPTGAAMVFLMAGPATNVATLGAVYRAFGGRSLAVYLVTIVVGSVAFGLGYEGLFGALTIGDLADHTHAIPWWGHLSAGLFALLLGWFAIDDLRGWAAKRAVESQMRSTEATAEPIVVQVGGMTCGGCSGKLQRLLQGEDDVESAMVSHADNQATVIGAISLARIHEIVEGAGFEVQG